jgi:DNA-binding winged helix-turn-helix (wHTH) protein
MLGGLTNLLRRTLGSSNRVVGGWDENSFVQEKTDSTGCLASPVYRPRGKFQEVAGVRLAELDPSSQSRDRSGGDKPLQGLTLPRTGIVLLILSSIDIAGLMGALKARGLRSAMVPLEKKLRDIVSDWKPPAVILQAGVPEWGALLRFLVQRDIPIVLLGTPERLARAQRDGEATVHLLLDSEPTYIAEVTELVIGPGISRGLPESIDLGVVKINLRSRIAKIEGETVELPRMEFDLLVELALRPGQPVESSELLRRLWPQTANATSDDVHSHVFRLRQAIGDHRRTEPLIATRRGFGYLLDLDSVKVE